MADRPLFVTRAMVDGLREQVEETVVVVPSEAGRGEGLSCHALERPAAAQMLGTGAHEVVAEALAEVLLPLVAGPGA